MAPIIGEIRSFAFGSTGAIDSKENAFEKFLRPQGWLECDGQSLQINIFKRLHNAIGANWGSEDHGLTFKVPDLTGAFIRGWNHDAGRDPDVDGRVGIHPKNAPKDFPGAVKNAVGSLQASQNLKHSHDRIKDGEGSTLHFALRGTTGGQQRIGFDVPGGGPCFTSESGGNESRPVNVYVMWCIFTGRQIPAGKKPNELPPEQD